LSYITQLKNSDGLPIPHYQTAHSAGVDLYAAVDGSVTIEAGAKLVPPALLPFPEGYEGQYGRSGLALKHGIGMLNAPGRSMRITGEIGVILFTQRYPVPFTERPSLNWCWQGSRRQFVKSEALA
jgi:dUTP pyrophosphatase